MKDMKQTYYTILGLDSSASEREIKQAYRRFAQEFHPDKAANEEERKKNEHLFADVSKAYNVLKDKVKRVEYDRTLRKEGKKSQKREEEKRDLKGKSRSNRSIHALSPKIAQERGLIAKKAYTKGMKIFKNGDYDNAVKFFEAAIENDDEEAIYFYRLSMSMMRARKSFTKAVEYCQKAIGMDPYNMDYKILLGEIYEKAGVHTKAKDTYEEIIKWDNTNERARLRLEALGYSVGKSKSFFIRLFRKISGK